MAVAPIYEMDAGLRRTAEEAYHKRGGPGQALPGSGAIAGRGRVDLRFAQDNDGELYILTKSDGMIRKVVGARVAAGAPLAAAVPPRAPGTRVTRPPATPSPHIILSQPRAVSSGKPSSPP